MSTPAGWYPDPERPGQQRYWDGNAWTDQSGPSGPPGPPPPGYPPPGPGYPPPGPAFAGGGYGPAMGQAPPNYLVQAILATVLCCLPLGIVAIIKAVDVNNKWNMGDAAGAQKSSEDAKKFATWSAIAGIVVGVLYGIFIVAVAGSST